MQKAEDEDNEMALFQKAIEKDDQGCMRITKKDSLKKNWTFTKKADKNAEAGDNEDAVSVSSGKFGLRRMITDKSDGTISDRTGKRVLAKGSDFIKRLTLRKQQISEAVHITRKRKSNLEGHALFCFGPENPVRMFVAEVTAHPYFESMIFVFVALSCTLIAIEPPMSDPNDPYNRVI